MDIEYTSDLSLISPELLGGFFVGWPVPPTPETLMRLLRASTHRVLAMSQADGRCIGYITALTDGVLFGYISSLEVLPQFQSRGIGKELVARMLRNLSDLYAIDLVCDADVQSFYERCGMAKCSAMVLRNRERLTT